MRLALVLTAALALLLPAVGARAQGVAYVVSSCTGNTLATGPNQPLVEDATGHLCTVSSGGGGNASVGTNGAAAPTSSDQAGGKDGSGNLQPLSVSTTGVLDSPRAGTANRVVTKTSLTLNTSTTVCPTATAPISTELFFTTAGVGISLAGGTLTTATIGTTASTTPDLSFATANTLYTLPVAPTNIITAYGAAGIVVCIQNIRQ